MAFLFLLGTFATAGAAHLLGMLLAGLRFGAPVELVGLFVGPKVFDIPLRRYAFRVHLLPLGCYVKFKEEGFYALAPLARVAILLAGPALMLLLGVALVGPETARTSLQSTFAGLLGLGKNAEAASSLKPLGRIGLMGLIILHLGVLNLLPLPPLHGGQALVTLLFGRRCTPAVMAKAVQVGHYVIIALFLAATFVELRRIYPR